MEFREQELGPEDIEPARYLTEDKKVIRLPYEFTPVQQKEQASVNIDLWEDAKKGKSSFSFWKLIRVEDGFSGIRHLDLDN